MIEENTMTIWETMLATVPAILVGVTMLVIVAKSINTRIDDLIERFDRRIDDTNKRIDDINRRIDDLSNQLNNLQGMFMSIFGEEIKKIMKKKTGTDN